MKKQTNDLVVVPTNVNPFIQIGEIIEIIPPSIRRKNDNQTEEIHFIESDLFSYPSNIRTENQISLKDFFVIITPVLCIGIFLFFPFPAFATEKIKQKVKETSVSDLSNLDEIAKANGFKVVYPSYVKEKIASEALKAKSLGKLGKTSVGRRLVEKVEKVVPRSIIPPLFNLKPHFQDKELFIKVGEPIIEKIFITNRINGNKILLNKFENSYLFLFASAIGILQLVDSENVVLTLEKLEKIRGGALPAVLGWFSQAKKNVEQVIDVVRGKNPPKNEANWADFFPSEGSSNTNKSDKNNTNFGSVLSQINASGGSGASLIAIWYFLALYNKSKREGNKFLDLVPEIRRVSFKEKLYNFAMKLIDLSTPTPYAIILLATFIYFFVYAGKGNNPVDNAFSFVNTLFQQLVKATEATEATQEYQKQRLDKERMWRAFMLQQCNARARILRVETDILD
jgi:hypothetical protein